MSFAPPPPMPPPPPGYGNDQGGVPAFTLATWPKRVLGALIDGVVPFVLQVIGRSSGSAGILFQLLAIAFIVWNLVRQGNTGQTIGKTVVRLKLVTEASASPVGIAISIGRQLLHILDAIPCYLGFLWPLWDKKRQTFADKILHTVVIDVP